MTRERLLQNSARSAPVPGAATSEFSAPVEILTLPLFFHVAAPEDGRTPTVLQELRDSWSFGEAGNASAPPEGAKRLDCVGFSAAFRATDSARSSLASPAKAVLKPPQSKRFALSITSHFAIALLLAGSALGQTTRPRTVTKPQPTQIITPTSKPEFAASSDLTVLQCGNLIYAGNQSSVCFADRFLTDVAQLTNLRVNKKFCPVRLDAEAVFDFPFCVMSGNESFTLAEKERKQFRKYLAHGGFLLVSPGCSDEKWDKCFRQEIKACFPEHALKSIPMSHPIFSLVNQIPRLTDKHGRLAVLEGLEMSGRLVLVYSKEGLNDVEHAKGCCCCGGNELRDPARVNVNVFTYAVLY